MLKRIFKRLHRGLTTLPGPGDWLELGVAAVLFALAALLLAGPELLSVPDSIEGGAVFALAARVLLVPSLLEEAVFRGALNPHPRERTGRRDVLLWGLLSVTAYTAMHPLNGVLLLALSGGASQAGAIFLDPAFIALVALLGLACLILYRRSGSLWTPTLLHALVVTVWLSLGGSGVLPAP